MPNFRILEGHWLDKARELPDKSIHMVVTSPPYWGLRAYKTEPQVWGGRPDCEHDWTDYKSNGQSGGNSKKLAIKGVENFQAFEGATCATCATCGAWRGELGQEPTPALFIEHLVEVFREVRRVLRDDGTLWINIGDSYATGAGSVGEHPGGGKQGARWKDHSKGRGTPSRADGTGSHSYVGPMIQMNRLPISGRKAGDLVGIPWTLAFALQADGWYLRRDNIWAKVNCMPESVYGTRWEKHRIKIKEGTGPDGGKAHRRDPNRGDIAPSLHVNVPAEWTDCPGCKKCDTNDGLILRRGSGRPTTSHEYIFMLSKTADYFYDSDAVAEAVTSGPSDIKKMVEGRDRIGGKSLSNADPLNAANSGTNIGNKRAVGNPTSRNKRSVWTITSQPYTEDHFAAFPEELPEICIKAGTSERGVCAKCGDPWARVVNVETETEQVYGDRDRDCFPGRNGDGVQKRAAENPSTKRTLGWRPTCDCNAGEPIPATVLDPFLGRGTTGTVALRLGRDFIGCDLQPNYVTMARKNMNNEAPLFISESVVTSARPTKEAP